MNKKAKSGICILGLLILSWVICLINHYTLVIPISNYHQSGKALRKGEVFNPLTNLNFRQGKWTAYLIISKDDYNDINPEIPKACCLKTTDKNVLQKIKKEWLFKYNEADLATVESSIRIYKDGQLMFESGIVLDKAIQGLQSQQFGWITPVHSRSMIETCKSFKRVYWPIVILN